MLHLYSKGIFIYYLETLSYTLKVKLHKKWSYPFKVSSHLLNKSLIANFILCAVLYDSEIKEI